MAGKGRKVLFHGSFGTKQKAKRKERTVANGYIRRVTVRRKIRYAVLSRRRG